jgi:uncharacterized protein YbbC (DUF1343 family)
MLAAGSRGQPVHVVDRPNPLGLDRVEGPGLGEGHGSGPGLSEVACLDLPIRYGLSPGELAFYLSRTLDLPEPRVIPWTRESDPWGADFVAPSPNLRDLEAIRLYPATCLLEGLNLSLGRGTERPFGWFGSPGLDVSGLLEDLEPPPGVSFRPRTRIPTVSRRAGEECPGVDLLGLMEVDQPVLGFGVRLLESLGRHLPGGFDWIQTRDGRYWLDVLWGGSELRLRLNSRDDMESLGEAAPIPDLVQTCWIHPRRTCPENPG